MACIARDLKDHPVPIPLPLVASEEFLDETLNQDGQHLVQRGLEHLGYSMIL